MCFIGLNFWYNNSAMSIFLLIIESNFLICGLKISCTALNLRLELKIDITVF